MLSYDKDKIYSTTVCTQFVTGIKYGTDNIRSVQQLYVNEQREHSENSGMFYRPYICTLSRLALSSQNMEVNVLQGMGGSSQPGKNGMCTPKIFLVNLSHAPENHDTNLF